MTLPAFGRALPIHCSILCLAGYDLSDPRARFIGDELDRLKTMRDGLEELIDHTEVDFGFDLKAWRELLLTFDEFHYRHPYAFGSVDEAVVAAINDSGFRRMADLAAVGRDKWEEEYIARRARRRARQSAIKDERTTSPYNDASDIFIRAIQAHLDVLSNDDA